MARNAAKSTKKFVQSGHLARTIKDRKRKQDVKRKIDNRKALRKGGPSKVGGDQGEDEEDEDMDPAAVAAAAAKKSNGGVEGDDSGDELLDDETLQALLAGSDDEDAESEDDGLGAEEDGLEDLEGEEEKHKLSLQALKEKDPEFYKYLEENDKTLLEFGEEDEDDEDDDEPVEEDEAESKKKSKKGKEKAKAKVTVVTKDLVKQWQKQMLQQRSLKALRKVLLCFRTAAKTDDEEAASSSNASAELYSIPNAVIFNKVVTTALKYTPLVLNHHVPWKEMPNGKFKLPTQSKKYATAQRIIKSYFSSLLSLLNSLSATAQSSLTQLAITDSSRLVPFIVGNRKASKDYLRTLLSFWSNPSSDDSIRLSAFLGIRKLALAGDQSLSELVLKGTYLAIQGASKNTTVFTVPSLNLMKNSASSLFLLNQNMAYQVGFSYIRQLAVTLRNSMKSTSRPSSGPSGGAGGGGADAGGKRKPSAVQKGREPYRQVYNWQFYHSIDFWSLVLAASCDQEKEAQDAKESELRPLIYPLVQITLGVIRLVPTSRYYPLRFQLITSLLRIVQRTGTYIPLSPFLLEVLDSSELSRKPKGSSLKPLDMAYYIRAPASYPKTRVYVDGIIDEVIYLLLEFFSTQSTSIAFPELTIPVIVSLRRHIKKSKNGKLTTGLKALVERLESNSTWIEEKRSKVEFSPQDREQVDSFLAGEENTPLRTYLKLQRKVREQKRELLEKSLQEDDDDADIVEGGDSAEEAMDED